MSLPPLPWDARLGEYSAQQMRDFARLAVREALERIQNYCEGRIGANPGGYERSAGINEMANDTATLIRAMLKEYE